MATNAEVIKRIEDEIGKLKTKDFTMFFFTVDCKNVPNGSVVYTYELAYAMKQLGYNVKMLYQVANPLSDRQIKKMKSKGTYDKMDNQVFCGVEDWMGQEYADLEHINIEKENSWKVSPSDFLFIPEAFSSLMIETYKKKIPCQRYVLLQNFDYVTDFIPFGSQWVNFGIYDCIATTELQAKLLTDVMPNVNTRVLNPYIPEYFRKPVEPKKLVVNVISKKQSDVSKLMKTFYWKYPVYKFISFRDLRGMNREHYADMLKDGAITVWIDSDTPFGYGAVESMRCNDIVIGKIPEHIQEWMTDENGELIDNAVWFNSVDELADILADVIGSWMQDMIPQALYDNMEKTNTRYTKEKWDNDVKNLTESIVEKRINELTNFLNERKKNNNETNSNE